MKPLKYVPFCLCLGVMVAGLSTFCTAQNIRAFTERARIDFESQTDGLALLQPRTFPEVTSNYRMSWRDDIEPEEAFVAEMPAVVYSNNEVTIKFEATSPGLVLLRLRANWEPDERGLAQPLPVRWFSLTVDGATLLGDSVGGEITTHDDYAVREILVEEPGTVTVVGRARSLFYGESGRTVRRLPENGPAFELASKYQRGLNLANWHEVPLGMDWGDNAVTEEELRWIKDQGFDHVRIPVGWHQHVGPAPNYRIDQDFFKQIDEVLEQSHAAGLAMIINDHHYFDFMQNPEQELPKLQQIWGQIAYRYRNKPYEMAYEIINEPELNATAAVMNDAYRRIVRAIRRHDSKRLIMLAPGEYNTVENLKLLLLPDDDRIAVQIHLYDPFPVTHQGAFWRPGLGDVVGIRFPGPPETPVEIPDTADSQLVDWLLRHNELPADENPSHPREILSRLNEAASYSRRYNVPIYMGEFGVYVAADSADRARYCRWVRRACEARGFGWGMWDFKATFSYWDVENQRIKPRMRRALFDDE